jgi:hypothetical protein
MVIDVEALAMIVVVDAAKKWWRSNRPDGWDEIQHLASPAINVNSHAEYELAMAVADLIKLEGYENS